MKRWVPHFWPVLPEVGIFAACELGLRSPIQRDSRTIKIEAVNKDT